MKSIPTVIYFIASACCLGMAGEGCSYLSRDMPSGNCGAASVGVAFGFIVLAAYAGVRGALKWSEE